MAGWFVLLLVSVSVRCLSTHVVVLDDLPKTGSSIFGHLILTYGWMDYLLLFGYWLELNFSENIVKQMFWWLLYTQRLRFGCWLSISMKAIVAVTSYLMFALTLRIAFWNLDPPLWLFPDIEMYHHQSFLISSVVVVKIKIKMIFF